MTINRFCSSGVQAVADAANQIRLGLADVMIGAGTESMSVMPQIMGNKMAMNPAIFAGDEHLGIAYGMGLTAEQVANRWQVGRENRMLSPPSRTGALRGDCCRSFQGRNHALRDTRAPARPGDGEIRVRERTVDTDEGPRADSTVEKLGQAAAGVPCPGLGDGRQLVADVRRCRRGAAGFGKALRNTT
jgi:acetyl-CoA acyltransferase